MQPSPFWFVVAALAVWRLTHMLIVEDGPVRVFARLRSAGRAGSLMSILGCFYCLSLWTALPFALMLGSNGFERLVLWLAVSGAACLFDRLGQPTPANFHEDNEEDDHALLRRRASRDGNDSAGN